MDCSAQGQRLEELMVERSEPTDSKTAYWTTIGAELPGPPRLSLPVDVVTAILSHASLPTIGCAGRTCRDWLAASRSEGLGLAVLRRRCAQRRVHALPS